MRERERESEREERLPVLPRTPSRSAPPTCHCLLPLLFALGPPVRGGHHSLNRKEGTLHRRERGGEREKVIERGGERERGRHVNCVFRVAFCVLPMGGGGRGKACKEAKVDLGSGIRCARGMHLGGK